jgi:hypothetical protein
MNNQEEAEKQRARVAREQRFNDRLAESEASIAHLRHCARLQDSATAAVMEQAEKAEAELAALRSQPQGEPVAWPLGWSADKWAAWLKDRSIMLDPYIQGANMKLLAAWIEDHPKLYAAPPADGAEVKRNALDRAAKVCFGRAANLLTDKTVGSGISQVEALACGEAIRALMKEGGE